MTKTEIMMKLSSRTTEKVPAGWKTANGWAKEWKVSGPQARRILYQSTDAGLADRKNFRIWNGNAAMPTPHYRFKGEK